MSPRRGGTLTPILFALVGGFSFLWLLLGMLIGGSANVGTTLSNGRNVTVHSNSWMISSESDGDTCKTWTAGKEIVIGGDIVSVDGKRLATMKDVQVTVESGQIVFAADGQTIASFPR